VTYCGRASAIGSASASTKDKIPSVEKIPEDFSGWSKRREGRKLKKGGVVCGQLNTRKTVERFHRQRGVYRIPTYRKVKDGCGERILWSLVLK
jgi:hypothetical protein